MELVNSFSVKVPIEQAWALLTDVEKIAPCLPGASLEEIEGEEYRGSVKVKVGPITASYKGKAHFERLDQDTHTAVLKAEGRDTKGQGNASATITAKLEEDVEGTNVTVSTDLAITGKVASFGRGVLADVSAKLLGQFVVALEDLIANDGKEVDAEEVSQSGPVSQSAGEPSSDGAAAGGKRIFTPKETEPVDLLGMAGSPIIKRAIPAALGSLMFLIWILVRRSKKHRKSRS